MSTEETKFGTMSRDLIQKWRMFIKSIPYPLAIIDMDYNVVAMNPSMSRTFEVSETEEPQKCYMLFHKSDRPVESCPMQKARGSCRAEESEYYESSQNRFYAVNTSPIIEEDVLQGLICSVSDITEQKRMKESNDSLIEVYSNTINKLKTQATSAQKGRDAFLNMLEDINESYAELEELFMKLILVMVNSLDAKSPWTKGHSERVSIYAEQIAREMLMDSDEIKNIKLAGLLHDIGKIGTYDYLLDKPGKLTNEEYDIVKRHPAMGADILKDIKQLRDIIPLIRYHHEKLDGNGYPEGLSGTMIPLGAKILHVADSFDSMTSDRPYRPAPGIDFALAEFEKHRGIQFDGEIVAAFLNVLKKNAGSKLPSE